MTAADRSGRDHRPLGRRRAPVAVFVVAVLLLATLCAATIGVLSAARACVGGEGVYTKGQKNAVHALEHYLRSGSEADWQGFRAALAVPQGDRAAQIELERAHPDYDAAARAFVAGGTDPADVGAIILFYRLFRHAPLVGDAIDTWAAAGREIARLEALGDSIRAARLAGHDRERLPQFEREIDRIDAVLNDEELHFSRQLGRAARTIQNLLLAATAGLALALILAGVLYARRMWARLLRSQRAAQEGATRWGLAADAGQFGLVEWLQATDTAMLDPRAVHLFELEDALGGLYPARLLRERVHADDREALRAAAQRAIDSRHAFRQRVRLRLPSGRERHIEIDGRSFIGQGAGVEHMVGLVRDVTDEVAAQAEQLEERAARRTYEAKREFLSRVSHELRTPLNAVIGFSDLMNADPRDPLSPTQRARLARVVDGGQYLLRLVNDLLDVARLEVGALSVTLATVRLAPVLRDALALLDTARAARGVGFEIAAVPQDVFVVADAVRLKQVFVNILSNAIKYNRPHGSVHLGFALTAAQVVLSVRDEGAGMTAQQQRELFVPFRRLGEHNATEGVGLGLVISRHLAERQGGSLDLASAPGQGTTVTIRLKRELQGGTEADGDAAASDFAPAPGGAGAVVLYIEDDPVNVVLVEQYLGLCADVQLVVARDAATGLALARGCQPVLILLDMQLPDMSGLEVLARLRADPGTRDIRVVALSADAMPAQVDEALARGAAAYWTKPLSLARFRKELPKFLG